MGAEDFPSQKIGGPGMYFPVFGLLCGPIQGFLHSIEQFPAHNSLMRITNDRPFIGAGPDLFVVDDLGDALHKIAGINFCPENFGNRARLPIPISDQILMG